MAKQLIRIAQPLNQKLTSTRLQNLIHRNHHQRQKHHHQFHNYSSCNYFNRDVVEPDWNLYLPD